MKAIKFTPHVCNGCGQTTEYPLALDRGTAEIVIAIAAAIRRKGINVVHPTKEMEVSGAAPDFRSGWLNSNQIGNISRAHRHGLVAAVEGKGNAGNWLLTPKGAKFLKGARIPRYALVSKVTGHQEGYINPGTLTVTIGELLRKEEHWDGIDFTIENGRIIDDVPIYQEEAPKEYLQPKLFGPHLNG